MKTAILGGGLTGMTTAYFLAKKGHSVTLFERELFLGGLSSGFKEKNWQWSLERTYHHLFSNDNDILDFAKEIGFDGFILNSPQTASLYKVPRQALDDFSRAGADYRTIPVDTPQDFIRLPILGFFDKLRAGAVVVFLKLSPFLSLYEKQVAKDFLIKTMGGRVWIGLWEELFRKKFGKYAENILASFIWARIKKRSKNLIYIKGGFQSFIDFLETKIKENGGVIKKNYEIDKIEKEGNKYIMGGESFDAVVSTLPTPVLIKISKNILPENLQNRLKKIKYLHAISLIIETEKPILNKTYWLNINIKKIPFVGLVQHTNMVDKNNYGGKHLLYVANYVDSDSPLLQMNKEEILNYYLPHLKTLNSNFLILNSYFFRSPWAQPIFDKEFLKNKPDFITSLKNFYIANLDMTYPYDRGTNFAVKLGKEVCKYVYKKN